MSCEPIRELLEAYALELLDDEERASVDAHLAGCPECRRLTAEYEAALAGLPDALALASPLPVPASLKARLLRAMGMSHVTAHGSAGPSPERARPLPARSALRRTLVFAGAVVVALSVAACSVALDRERTLRERFAGLYGDQELILELVDARETSRLLLRPPNADSPAYGKLFTNPQHREVVVMAARLGIAGEGRAYRIWLTQNRRTFAAGTLKVNDKGFGLLVFESKRAGPAYDAARIVLQPGDATTAAGRTVLSWQR